MSFFGQNMRFLRNRAQLSQAAFAEIFNLKRSAVGAYEEERAEPKVEVFVMIARHFGVSVEDLVCRNMQRDGVPARRMEIDIEGLEDNAAIKMVKMGGVSMVVRELPSLRDAESMPAGKLLALGGNGYSAWQSISPDNIMAAYEILYTIRPYQTQDFTDLMLCQIYQKLEDMTLQRP